MNNCVIMILKKKGGEILQKLEVVMGATIGLVSYLFGGIDVILIAVAIFIFLDLLSGMLKSYINGTLNSRKSWARKGFYIIFLFMAVQLDYAVNKEIFRFVICSFIIGSEGISIIENASLCGISVPQVFLDKFEQLKENKGEQ